MIRRQLNDITTDDLHSLVENEVEESRTLEFKEDLGTPNGGTRRINDEQKKELLADVSALANTSGGDLVIGIREEAGKASEVVGLALDDPDKEFQKLESILRDSLEPRLPSTQMRAVPFRDRVVLIIRSPRSWIGPHRVKQNNRFYARNSNGKYPMDVTELRQAFTLGEALTDRIKGFRRERLAIIQNGETPYHLADGPLAVFHIVPLTSMTSPVEIPFDQNEAGLVTTENSLGHNNRYTLEGFASSSGPWIDQGHDNYSLLFRNGFIESVRHCGHPDKEGLVFAQDIERHLAYVIPSHLERLKKEGIEGPYYVLLTLLNVASTNLYYQLHHQVRRDKTLRSPAALFPGLIVEHRYDLSHAQKLCDLLFNAYGFPRSFSFDMSGDVLKFKG